MSVVEVVPVQTEEIFLVRQPVVDRENRVVGFQLKFRAARAEGGGEGGDVRVTSTVVANAFAEIGIDQVIGGALGFIGVDNEFLNGPLIEALPAERIVLTLTERQINDDETLERCVELRRQGYRIAVDDFVGNVGELDTLLPNVDFIQIDFARLDPLLVPVIVELLQRGQVKLAAKNVETPDQFRQAKSLGIDFFQGYHFARPELLAAKRAKPSKLGLLRLMSLATNDAETQTIEDEFKRHPALAINLLRLANSAAFVRRQTVTSLRHALVMLGRRQLRIWLQLLLYTADQGESFGSPLLQTAAVRGKLMELIYAKRSRAESEAKDLAFITGILSLMDVLLEIPHATILDELNLPEPVRAALLRRLGPLGNLLNLAEALERGEPGEVVEAIRRVGWVPAREVLRLQADAFDWVNRLVSEPAAGA
jgi:c-di-GMP phosphodiesterase